MEKKVRKAFEVADELARKVQDRDATHYELVFARVFDAMMLVRVPTADNRTAAGLAQSKSRARNK